MNKNNSIKYKMVLLVAIVVVSMGLFLDGSTMLSSFFRGNSEFETTTTITKIKRSSKPMMIRVMKSMDLLVPELKEITNNHGTSTTTTTRSSMDLVVSFVDSSYLGVLRIWLHYYAQHYQSQRVLCLIALDDECFTKLERIIHAVASNNNSSDASSSLLSFGEKVVLSKINSSLTPIANETKVEKKERECRLWAERVRFMDHLLNELPQYNQLFSDVDALWLKDPQIFLDRPSAKRSDIIASKGKYPTECPVHDGDTICFGFIYFQNTPALRNFTRKMVKDANKKLFSDQKEVNCLLFHHYAKVKAYEEKDHFSDEDTYKEFVYQDIKKINNETTTGDLRLLLLPYHQVRRACKDGNEKNATVAHCNTPKDGETKIQKLKGKNLIPQYMENISEDALWSR